MTGLFITNFELKNFSIANNTENTGLKTIFNEKLSKGISFQRNTLDKFINDKVFCETDDFIVVIEGLVLNSKILAKENKVDDLEKFIIKSLTSGKYDFYDNLRGSFCGAFLIKKTGEIRVFTNHTGDRPIFYYVNNDKYIFTSNIKFMLDFVKSSKIAISLNKNAVYSMITFGNMVDNSTYANEIKRLLPGEFVEVKSHNISISNYSRFVRNKIDTSKMTDEEIVAKLDNLFTNAVKMEYAKDNEYGYKHYAHLSGGLDTRMSNFIAKENGYDDILNFTYTQSNSYDEKIAKKISYGLGNELWVRYMDCPKFIYDVDKIVKYSGGLFIYVGMTNGLRCLEELNSKEYGVLHTGLIGDVVLGTCMKQKSDLNGGAYVGAYSKRLAPLFRNYFDQAISKYDDYELFYLYACSLLTNSSFPMVYHNYTEFASPFMDKDFIDFCYSLDLDKRIDRHIYFKWIKTCHKSAGDYEWTSSHVKINAKFYNLKRIVMSVLKKIVWFYYGDNNDMNPTEKWYKTNGNVRSYIDTYIKKGMELDIIDDDLRKILLQFLDGSTCLEKLQLMTALSSIKMYFCE